MKKSINGVLVELTPEEEEIWQQQVAEREARAVELAKMQYRTDRMLQFPSIGDQLDTLFHDMTAGKGTKDGEWYKAIEQVKSDNPKPE